MSRILFVGSYSLRKINFTCSFITSVVDFQKIPASYVGDDCSEQQLQDILDFKVKGGYKPFYGRCPAFLGFNEVPR